MAKRCTRCGNFLMDDERFCTRCGENVSNVMPEAVPPAVNAQPGQGYQNAYSAPNQQGMPYGQPNTYAQPVLQPAQEEMSLGKWVGTIIVTTFFGLISLIFLFIWGFGDGPECRKRYCKAMLIVDAISLGIVIIIYIFIFAAVFGSMGSFWKEFSDAYKEYGQTAAVQIASFLGM